MNEIICELNKNQSSIKYSGLDLPVASRHFKILTPTSVGNFPRSHDVFEFCLRRCKISENADADVYKYIFFQIAQNRVIFRKIKYQTTKVA